MDQKQAALNARRMAKRLGVLHDQNEAIHADLEAVAVAARTFQSSYHGAPGYKEAFIVLQQALARPGVVAVLEGVKA